VTVPVWVLPVLLAITGAVGVLSGFVAHWWLEARALRPAYLAQQACIRTDTGTDTLRG
jgi:hypothetical protein